MNVHLRHAALAIVAVAGLTCLGGTAAIAQESIVGTWTGVIDQQPAGPASSYTGEFTFTSPTSGTSSYPSLKCGGTLSGGGSGTTYRFRETITFGRVTPTTEGCIDGNIEIGLNGGRMSFRWTGSFDGQSIVATGTLQKRGYTGKRFYHMFAKSWIDGPAITEPTWHARKISMDVNTTPQQAAAGTAFDYKIYQTFGVEVEFVNGMIVNAQFTSGSRQQLANTTFGLPGQVRMTGENVAVSPDKTRVVFERRIEGNPHSIIKAADVAAAQAVADSWGLSLPATNIKIHSVLRLTVTANGATPEGEGSAFPTHSFWIRENGTDRLFKVQPQVQPSQYFR